MLRIPNEYPRITPLFCKEGPVTPPFRKGGPVTPPFCKEGPVTPPFCKGGPGGIFLSLGMPSFRGFWRVRKIPPNPPLQKGGTISLRGSAGIGYV
jgi:hypothetical protein